MTFIEWNNYTILHLLIISYRTSSGLQCTNAKIAPRKLLDYTHKNLIMLILKKICMYYTTINFSNFLLVFLFESNSSEFLFDYTSHGNIVPRTYNYEYFTSRTRLVEHLNME